MKDFWKRKRNKRIAASALAVVMAGFLVWGLFPWQAAAAGTTVADDVTINNWHKTLDDSTKNVGRIWTDKSVSTQDIKLPGTTIEGLTDNTVKKEAGADFLVALSGLGSAATIVDETKVPTDTVIVLDMAPEMEPYVEDMVAAANDALENLLTANPNNRIAVVAYGNTAIPCCRWITTATIPISPRRSCCRLGSMITVFGQIPLMSLPMARRMRASQLSRKNLSLTAEKRETRRLVFIPVWIFCSKRRIPLSPWTVSS